MKRFLSLLVAMVLLSSLWASSFAEAGRVYKAPSGDWADVEDAILVDFEEGGIAMPFPETGITLYMPEAFLTGEGLMGRIQVIQAEEVEYQSGVWLTTLDYVPHGQFDPNTAIPYITFLCYREGCDEATMLTVLDHLYVIDMYNIGDFENYTLSVGFGTVNLPDGVDEASLQEYSELLKYASSIVYSARFYAPAYGEPADAGANDDDEDDGNIPAGFQIPASYALTGLVFFDTLDLDGNRVISDDLFEANEVTMINIWETGCGPCKEELPELAALHRRLQEMGCGIVGLVVDDDEEDIQEAKRLLQAAGADYPSVRCPSNFEDLFFVVGYPTTFFVDREGNVVGSPIQGAYVEKYEPAIRSILAGDDTPSASRSASIALSDKLLNAQTIKTAGKRDYQPGESVYTVICVDEAGSPVPGVKVQLCDDDMCRMAKTDEDGVARFDAASGDYVIHVLKVPEGYAKDSTEYEAPALAGEVTIVLKAA